MASIPQGVLRTRSPLCVALDTSVVQVQMRLSGQAIEITLDDGAGHTQPLCQIDADTAAQLADVLSDFARGIREDQRGRAWSAIMVAGYC